MSEELRYQLIFKFRVVDKENPFGTGEEMEREEIISCVPEQLKTRIFQEKSRLSSIANQYFSVSHPNGRVEVTLSGFMRVL